MLGNRGAAQSELTAKRYTGQYHEAGLAGAEGLYYYNARWYDPALGRFIQADTLVPEPGNPQALNRFAYVYGNPVNYADPSGHAVPIDVGGHLLVHPTTGNIIVASIAGSGLRQIIAQASVGQASAAQRLTEILDRTAGTGQFSGAARLDAAFGKATRTHFQSTGAIKGDAGFAPEFQDDYLYAEQWGFETPASKQTGHFLTAVDMGRSNGWVHSIVGHEQSTDSLLQGGPLVQLVQPAATDIDLFYIAASLDASGYEAERDTVLGMIFDPSSHGDISERRGNSMEDLRLSVRGWRLGGMVETG